MSLLDIKIKLLTERLEKESGKKVILKEDIPADFIKSAGRNRGGDPKEIKKELNIIKQSLSSEGWKLVEQFIGGASGMNRYWTISTLAQLFSGKIPSITKSVLQSYTNKILFGLLETGDLIQQKKGVITPAKTIKSPEISKIQKQTTNKKGVLDLITYVAAKGVDSGINWHKWWAEHKEEFDLK